MITHSCTLQIETEYYIDDDNIYIILPKDGDELKILSVSENFPNKDMKTANEKEEKKN